MFFFFHSLVIAELQKTYGSKGFSVLAFPISDFHQELGSNKEILSFVRETFPEVDFPIFSLNSLDNSPVYQSIKKQKPEEIVRWNFHKFLIDGNGQVVATFDTKVNPLKISKQIEEQLEKEALQGRKKHVISWMM